MTGPIVQYPLAFATGEPPSFHNYVPGQNREVLGAVRDTAAGRGNRYLFLAGPTGTGKTHLLIAAARAARGFYLDPAEPGVDPEAMDRLEAVPLVCVDGLGAASGHADWEQALFRLFNALESAGTPLILADRSPPARLDVDLPDLASRLASGPVLGLSVPRERDLERVLVARARALGFELAPQVASYLVARERRDLRHLLALLDRLDRHSLAAQRPVTIPFVRSMLEEGEAGDDR